MTLRMPGSGCSCPWTGVGRPTRQVTLTTASVQPGRRPQPGLQDGRQLAGVGTRREPQFDVHADLAAAQLDGLHSFGVVQRHPEVGFDIIPDQQSGLGESIVLHPGVRRAVGGGMSRERGIVAETGRGLRRDGGPRRPWAAWHNAAIMPPPAVAARR